MRVLAITKIFPNAVEPLSAPFNRQQFAALTRYCEVAVMATVPWYPGAKLLARWSSAGKLSEIPPRDRIAGIAVEHPRTLFVPRLAHATWGPLYAASIAPRLRSYRGKVDVVLGSWAYPDGFAAVVAARMLGVPAVIKLHGSDLNVVAKLRGAAALTGWALRNAARVVAVSRALADEAAQLGARRDRIAVVINGVDPTIFAPRSRAEARRQLGLPADVPIALFVGNLKEVKGVHELAAAWPQVAGQHSGARLIVVGDGPLRGELTGLGDHAAMVGARPLDEVARYMAACDVLVLPSRAEGTPNVVLEALASGRRVVATAVGGVPDLIARGELGTLVAPRDPAALAIALASALVVPYDPAVVAELGARGGWDTSAQQLHGVLAAAVADR